MKTLLFVLLFLTATISYGQTQPRRTSPDIVDSLKSTRTSVMVDWGQTYEYTSVIINNLASGDSVGIYTVTDSVMDNNRKVHNRDTVGAGLRDFTADATYNTIVTGVTGTIEVFIRNPNIRRVYVRSRDAVLAKVIPFRVRGITY